MGNKSSIARGIQQDQFNPVRTRLDHYRRNPVQRDLNQVAESSLDWLKPVQTGLERSQTNLIQSEVVQTGTDKPEPTGLELDHCVKMDQSEAVWTS